MNLFSGIEPSRDSLVNEYGPNFLRDDINLSSIGIALWVFFGTCQVYSDWLFFGNSRQFWTLICCRAAFAVFGVLSLLVLRRLERVGTYRWVIFSFMTVAVLYRCFLSSTGSLSFEFDLMADVFIVFGLYLVFPNDLLYRVLPAFLLSLCTILICVSRITVSDPSKIFLLCLYLLGVNAVGLVVSVHWNNIRRESFRALAESRQAAAALEHSESKYRQIVDTAGDFIFQMDLNRIFTMINPATARILGYAEEAVIGRYFNDFVHEDHRSKLHRLFDAQLAEKISETYCEFPAQTKSAGTVWIGQTTQLMMHGETVTGFQVIGRDITARKRAEDELRESEENFRAFFETLDDMIIVATPDGSIMYSNPALSRKLGYSAEALEQMHLLDVHPKDLRDEAEAIFADMFGGKRDVCPLAMESKSGALVPVETRAWLGKWSGLDCIFGICKDLSREQEALQKFDKLFHSNPALMAVSTIPERKFSDVNDSFLKTLGFTRGEIIGKTSSELGLFVQPDQEKAVADRLEREGSIFNVELSVRRKDGAILEELFSGEIIESQGRQMFLTVMVDVTERRKAEEALRISERRYRELTENSLTGIFIHQDGRVVFVNQRLAEMLGYAVEEMMGRNAFDAVHPDDRETIIERARSRLRGELSSEPYQMRLLKKNGEVIWCDLLARGVDYRGRPAIMGNLADVSERKAAEQALRESEEKYRLIFSKEKDAIVLTDAETGRFLDANKSALKLWGYNREELLSMTALEMSAEPEESRKSLGTAAGENGVLVPIRLHRNKDGTTFPVEISAGSFTWNGRNVVCSILRDVSERNKAEEALRKAEELWQLALEGGLHGVWDWNPTTNKVFFSQLWKSMLGYQPHEISDTLDEWEKRVHPEDKERCFQDLERHFKGETDYYVNEHRLLCKDGTFKWILDRGRVVEWSDQNEALRVVGTHTDMTELKKAQEALKRSEERHRRVFDNIQDVYVEALLDSTVLEVSPSVRNLLGFSPEELIGTSILDIYCSPEVWESLISRLTENGRVQDHELALKSKDGRMVECSTNARLLWDQHSGAWHICGVIRDIEERKLTEKILRTNALRLQAILSSLHVGLLLVSADNTVEFANQAFCDIFDQDGPPQQLHGLTSTQMLHRIQTVYAQPTDAITRIKDIVAKQRAVRTEEVALSRGRTVLRDFVPIMSDENRHERLWQHLDITDRKKADEQIQASLKEKEVLLREIHHRVKNNLALVCSLLTLQSGYASDESHHQMFEDLEARIRSMAMAHERLYQSKSLASLNMSEYVNDLVDHLVAATSLGTAIEIRKEIEPLSFGLDTAIPIGFLLTELVSNCLKHAFPESRRGRIEVSLSSVGENGFELVVSDDGVGMPEEIDLENPESLGLDLVRAFVAKLKGSMEIARDRGTSVRVSFREV